MYTKGVFTLGMNTRVWFWTCLLVGLILAGLLPRFWKRASNHGKFIKRYTLGSSILFFFWRYDSSALRNNPFHTIMKPKTGSSVSESFHVWCETHRRPLFSRRPGIGTLARSWVLKPAITLHQIYQKKKKTHKCENNPRVRRVPYCVLRNFKVHSYEMKKYWTLNKLPYETRRRWRSTYYMGHTHIGLRDTCMSQDKDLERRLTQW